MTFLNTGLMLGLVLIGVPLLLHLLARRRLRPVPFSTLAFLEKIQSRRTRRLRLRQWLLLLLRTLAILFLVLAFLRPAIRGASAGFGNSETVMLLDLSASMAARDVHSTSSLDRARKAIADIWKAGGVVGVVVADREGARDIQQTTAAGETPAWVDALSTDGRSQAPAAGMVRALSRLEKSGAGVKEVLWMSDFAGATPDSFPPLPPDVKLRRIDVGPEETPENISVYAIRMARPLARPGMEDELEARFQLTGAEKETTLFEVTISGRKVAEGEVQVKGLDPSERAIPVRLPEAGLHALEVEIEDEDALALDNHRTAILSVPPVPRVLLSGGDIPALRTLELALTPGAGLNAAAVTVKPGPPGTENLENADVLLLVSPEGLNDEEIRRIVEFVSNGGGLWLFAGERMDPAALSRALLRETGFGPIIDVLRPGSVPWGEIDQTHPALRGLLSGRGRFELPKVAKRLNVMPGEGTSTLIRLADGGAFLLERNVGRGRVWWTPCALSGGWTDWPATGAFAPVVQAGVVYLASKGQLPAQQVMCGQVLRWRERPEVMGSVAEIEDPLGNRIPAAPSAEPGIAWETSATRWPGIYKLLVDGKEAGIASIVLDPSESLLERIPDASLPGRKVHLQEGESLADALERLRVGREVSVPLLLAALAMLVTESLLARERREDRTDSGEQNA
ncbi:MAG: BatA domain-containing protein [bacterium]